MTSPPLAFYLPPGFAAAPPERETVPVGRSAVSLALARLDPAALARLALALRSSREQDLANRPTEAVLAALGHTAERWLDRGYPPRAEAEAWLPRLTGYAAGTIRASLDTLFAGLRAPVLWGLIEEELGHRQVLDTFVTRRHLSGRCRAYGPRLTVISCAGNVPVASLPSLVHGLLVKSACLVRVSRSEPLLPSLFLQSLAQEAPWLAGCLAAVTWTGAGAAPRGAELPLGAGISTHSVPMPRSEAPQQPVEQKLGATGDESSPATTWQPGTGATDFLTGVDAWIGYGSDETLTAIRRSLPDCVRFLPHGHRIGFAVVTREKLASAALEGTASLAAADVAAFDQQGCVSPRLFLVEQGGAHSPRDFAGALAGQLEALRDALPRCPLDAGEAASLHQRRAAIEMRQFAGQPVALFRSAPGTDWTVIVDPQADLSAAGTHRTAVIRPFEQLSDVSLILGPFRRFLQTAAIAAGRERWPEIAGFLGEYGVTRICPLGRTQRTAAGWHHDGRLSLGDLVRWADWDEENSEPD
jgi:Acyl-CoA reductase (LuxC)